MVGIKYFLHNILDLFSLCKQTTTRNTCSMQITVHANIILLSWVSSGLEFMANYNYPVYVQCWTNVEYVGSTLYKCYSNVLCLLG